MSDCIEVLFASDGSGRLQTANCYNSHIGTTLMTYRGGGGAAKNCLALIGNDYLISADVSQPLLRMWPLNSQEPSHDLKTVLPGKPSALCVSPDGYYCVCGIEGKVYVWQTSNGVLFNVISKHFQPINKIVFTDDSSHFVTAGEDGLVLVWKLADVVAKQFGDIHKLAVTQTQPVFSFSQHSLPVTDMHLGRGNIRARLFTVSADQTCKIYSLGQGTLLLSVVFDYVLTAVTVNELETELFVGTSSGKIQIFYLDPYPRTLEHHASEESNEVGTFIGHTKPVTCLSTSFDGITLASGSNDEKIFLWNIPSRQLLRSFEMKGSITNMFFSFASSNIFTNKFEPSLVIKKFEKISNIENRNLEINVLVHEDVKPISFTKEFEKVMRDKKSNEEFFERNDQHEGSSEDVTALKQQIMKLKDVNKQLYQFAMNKILNSPLIEVTGNGHDDADDEML